MSGFYGRDSVVRTRDKQRRTGKLVSATLSPSDGSADVTFANVYVWPRTEASALGSDGSATVRGQATIYRLGESSKPRVMDSLTVSSLQWVIDSVVSRLNADESSGYAVYDLTLQRPAKSTD